MSKMAQTIDPLLADCRILVVDDKDDYRSMIVRYLTRAGLSRIETAGDGDEGLAQVARFQPDLILLDVNMPRMDGYEMCRQLRANPETADIPVLFQTGAASELEQSECFAVGGNDYIAKPMRLSECLARIAVHLRLRQMVMALRNYASRVESELTAARAMQAELTPPLARVEELAAAVDLAIEFHVEPSSELGGDAWTILDLGNNRIGLLLADFSGHGIAAAINTFRLHTLITRHPPDAGDPGKWMSEINDMLCDMLTEGQFAAAFFGVLERGSDLLRYAACGGPNPILIDETGPRFLDGSGLMLGIAKGMPYDTREVRFPPNAALLLYSDALSEARTTETHPLGESGILQLYQEMATTGRSPIAFLLDRGLASRRPLKDDLTLVWVARQPGS